MRRTYRIRSILTGARSSVVEAVKTSRAWRKLFSVRLGGVLQHTMALSHSEDFSQIKARIYTFSFFSSFWRRWSKGRGEEEGELAHFITEAIAEELCDLHWLASVCYQTRHIHTPTSLFAELKVSDGLNASWITTELGFVVFAEKAFNALLRLRPFLLPRAEALWAVKSDCEKDPFTACEVLIMRWLLCRRGITETFYLRTGIDSQTESFNGPWIGGLQLIESSQNAIKFGEKFIRI